MGTLFVSNTKLSWSGRVTEGLHPTRHITAQVGNSATAMRRTRRITGRDYGDCRMSATGGTRTLAFLSFRRDSYSRLHRVR